MKGAYYNEHDPFAAQWLRNLIDKGLIAKGDVDERDIQEVKPDDLDGYKQVHLFAGIGGWSYALRLAGWDDDRPVWTGSCPCQPFSDAGEQQGSADARHLWPEMRRLITERTPPVCFGEQVASGLGCEWLASVFADLEKLEYRVAGADLCAAGVGALHLRQRLWWVADSERGGRERFLESGEPDFLRPQSREQLTRLVQAEVQLSVPAGRHRALADGFSKRMGRLRGYGNAIVPQVAATFIRAYLDTLPE